MGGSGLCTLAGFCRLWHPRRGFVHTAIDNEAYPFSVTSPQHGPSKRMFSDVCIFDSMHAVSRHPSDMDVIHRWILYRQLIGPCKMKEQQLQKFTRTTEAQSMTGQWATVHARLPVVAWVPKEHTLCATCS
jgi:hypothetical protein